MAAHFKLIFISWISGILANDYVRMCYYTNWSQKRGEFKFYPENIEPGLCTHVVMAFGRLDGNQLVVPELRDDVKESATGIHQRLNELKARAKNLKILLAVSNRETGTNPMTVMLSTRRNRSKFIKTTVEFLKEGNFDGLDLAFQYPGSNGSPPGDKRRFTLLVQELSKDFRRENLLLTASVPALEKAITRGYQIDKIGKYLDFVNVMTYGFHDGRNKATGHNSPLKSSSDDTLSIDWAMRKWRDGGVPAKKLLVGMAAYGRCFALSDRYKDGPGAPTTGACPGGNYTKEEGLLAYYEICTLTSGPNIKMIRSDEEGVPYAVSQWTWISYDDVTSLTKKVQYIKKNNFGGWFFWELSFDDFLGTQCGQGKYPLLKALNRALETVVDSEDEKKMVKNSKKLPWSSLFEFLFRTKRSTQNANITEMFSKVCIGLKEGRYVVPYNCQAYVICKDDVTVFVRCEQRHEYFSDTKKECVFEKELSYSRRKECLIEMSTGTPAMDLICQSKKSDGHYTFPGDCRTYIVCKDGKGDTDYCIRHYFFHEPENKCIPEQMVPRERLLECNVLRQSDYAQIKGPDNRGSGIRRETMVLGGFLILAIMETVTSSIQ